MPDVAVIVPTRGRPRRFAELLASIWRTAELDVSVWGGVDNDDDIHAYRTALRPFVGRTNYLVTGERKSLSAWTNHLALEALKSPNPPRYLATLGDDHRPRTPGWDRRLAEAIEALGGFGFAYGNDLLQGEGLCTAWVTSAETVRALGWLMLPDCAHMYVDNATLTLGRATELITYCPDVVISHEHPAAGKAPLDDSYRESNTPERYAADAAAFEAWRDSPNGLARDVDRLLAARLIAVGGG